MGYLTGLSSIPLQHYYLAQALLGTMLHLLHYHLYVVSIVHYTLSQLHESENIDELYASVGHAIEPRYTKGGMSHLTRST